ncbi:MAG: NADH-quinone oxidoreductase subunit A [Candidatus Micrarchaeales archaeon]
MNIPKNKKVDFHALSMDISYYNYIALVFFALFALFIPASFLLTSKLLRHKSRGNRVKNMAYESAEEPIGRSRDVDNEYLPFFAMFLPFEIIAIIIVLWSTAARNMTTGTNVLVIGLLIISMALALAGYKFTTDR